MLCSSYQIDLIKPSGAILRLLDFGDFHGEAPAFGMVQQSATLVPLGAEWGKADASKGLRRQLTWDRRTDHASGQDADRAVQVITAAFPESVRGTLRVTLQNGEVWDMRDATLQSVVCMRRPELGQFSTLTIFAAEAGKTVPVAGVTWCPGTPAYWDMTAHGMAIYKHDGSMPPAPTMDEQFQTRAGMVLDATRYWMQVTFQSAEILTGNAAAGYQDAGGNFKIEWLQSTDLVSWAYGKFSDESPAYTANGDGTYTYAARGTIPAWWIEVMCDFTISTARYGKSITGIMLKDEAVTLAHFPYAIPGQLALFEADLDAVFPGATAVITSGMMRAVIENHTVAGTYPFKVVMSGNNVTSVLLQNLTPVAGLNLPYNVLTQRANLQSDLRAAGYDGAVVTLYSDSLTITLPDVPAEGSVRWFTMTIDPPDPYPYWDYLGNYQGENPNTLINGTYGNVRTPGGDPLLEAKERQFCRLLITQLK